MTRTLALVTGALFTALSAGTLAAQSTAPAKPGASSGTMQHAPAPLPKAGQDSTTVHATATTKMHHARWTKDQIKQAQQDLAKDGYYKGKPTGTLGASTRNAIRAYQKANKLPVTGRLDTELLTKLHST